jgi:hypothetical protein
VPTKTRKIPITDRVFTLRDLVKIASIFKERSEEALRLDEDFNVTYTVYFSDDSTIESKSLDILDEKFLIGPARPTDVRFTFRNYTSSNYLSFRLSHGSSSYSSGNMAEISSEDTAWLGQNFLDIKESIETAKPQTFWFIKHPTLLLNLIALGIGSSYLLFTELIIEVLFNYIRLETVIQPLSESSPWREVLLLSLPFLYIFWWLWAWLLGHFTGAYTVRRWLLDLWPNIEFDFGANHLLTEKARRSRFALVLTLITVPIVVNLTYDTLKRFVF